MKNKGEDYYYSAKEVVEKTSGAEYYKQHMNEVRALCESTVLDKLTFKTVPSLQYKDSKATIFSTEDLGILFLKQIHLLLSTGGFQSGMLMLQFPWNAQRKEIHILQL